MVFCNLKSNDDGVLKYEVGGTPEDLTGTLIVNPDDLSFELEKEPEKTKVYIQHIAAMLAREAKNYRKKTFRNRISYEI